MKFYTGSALFFAASIALAIAAPTRQYYRPVSYEDDDEGLVAARQPYTLATSPFFYQPRTLELDEISNRGRKYKIVKRKKHHGGRPIPGSDEDEDEDDEPQDEEDDESSEEEADEEGGDNEEESLDVPPWEQLFPEEDKNTGTFDDQGGQEGGYGGQGGQGGSLSNLPGGAPAPQGSGSLMNAMFGGGSGSGEGGPGGPGGPQGGGGGGPPQYRQGPPPPGPPPRQYQAVRSRSSLVEEPRSGGAVLYDGYRYIPVSPVNVRIPQRQAKTIKKNDKNKSAKPSATPVVARQNKKLNVNKQQQYVVVPVDRDSREIRFSRDEHGFKVDHGPVYAPSEIWRWEGPNGRPLRRRENRPVFYTSNRPHRGSSIRFAQEDDY